MNIEEKFENGSISHTYQRVDSTYKTDIFLGYNDDGNMSMVITEYGKEAYVQPSKLIDVSLKKRSDQKMALSFNLLDGSYKTMFLMFCKDIILTCEGGDPQMVISNAITRWKYWKDLFGKKQSNLLDKMEIKGLIGELIVLRDYFIENWGSANAIQAWMGPLSGHKDFEMMDTWYEVKSVNENAIQVNISSLEQLESDVDGHLIIVRLEDTSSVSDASIDLNSTVMSVIDRIEDPEYLDLFKNRLDNLGYVPDQEYDRYNFAYKGRQSYKVTSGFPRMQRKNIDPSIGNAKYTILIDGIIEYLEA